MKVKPTIKAKVILDSLMNGERYITFITHTPRFLDPEIEKHGNISTNSSSSRAISFPITKNQTAPYMPATVTTPAKTMHSNNALEHDEKMEFYNTCDELYQYTLHKMGKFKGVIHKQHLNRYIEAFAMQTKVMTAEKSAWQNFIDLRISQADPSIMEFARKIKFELERSIPSYRLVHMPMICDADNGLSMYECALASAGRIAKSSYNALNDNGEYEHFAFSIVRGKMLINHNHKTPFEHQLFGAVELLDHGITHRGVGQEKSDFYSGRTKNAVQLRKLIWSGLEEKYEPPISCELALDDYEGDLFGDA